MPLAFMSIVDILLKNINLLHFYEKNDEYINDYVKYIGFSFLSDKYEQQTLEQNKCRFS